MKVGNGRRSFRRSKASWLALLGALGALVGSPAFASTPPAIKSPPSIAAFFDSGHGTEWVVYPDMQGNLIGLSCGGPNGCWHSQVLASTGTFEIGSPLVGGYDSTYNDGELYFIGTNGHYYEMWGEPPTNLSDLTQDTNPANGGPATQDGPWYETAGPGIVPGTNFALIEDPTPHLFYFDYTLSLHEAYWGPGWYDHIIAPPLSGDNGSLLLVGSLTSVWDGTLQSVFYNQVDYGPTWSGPDTTYLWDTAYPHTCNGLSNQWCTKKIVANLLNASVVPSGNLQSLAIGSGQWGVVGSEMFSNQWGSVGNIGSISTQSGGLVGLAHTYSNVGAEGPLRSFMVGTSPVGFYMGSDLNIYYAGSAPGTQITSSSDLAAQYWSGTDTAAVWNNQLPGFDDGTYSHIFYIGADFNIHEIYVSDSSLTSVSPGWNQHAIGGGGNVYHQNHP